MTSEDIELGDDLRITKTTRRGAGNGTWVCGTIAGHRFDALVFPEHAAVFPIADEAMNEAAALLVWAADSEPDETVLGRHAV
jgi:hypothetical protein